MCILTLMHKSKRPAGPGTVSDHMAGDYLVVADEVCETVQGPRYLSVSTLGRRARLC